MEQKQTKKEVKKKGMKRNEKIVIAVLLIITIILIVILHMRNSSNNSSDETIETSSESVVVEDGGYVRTYSDGTKLNMSEALNEDKEIDGIEITDIQLTESDNITQLLATLTNTSDETQGGYSVTLTLVDEDGEELTEMKAYIPELEPNGSTQLNTSIGFDYSDAYDFVISK